MIRLALAFAHLAALGIGLGAVWARARAFAERPLSVQAVRRGFAADTWWGIAAALWIATGLWRLLAGTEKATSFYIHDSLFMVKMTLLVVILALEVWPMMTLINWRISLARTGPVWQPEEGTAARIRTISYIEAMLVLAMVAAAVAMARGYGYRG